MAVTTNDFKPTKDQLVVLVPKIKDRTDAGLLKSDGMIAEEAKNMSQFFEVVSVGSEVKEVNVGQYVHVNMNRCLKLPIVESILDDYQVGIVREYDVYGVSNVR